MATYSSYGSGLSLFQAYTSVGVVAPMSERLLYVTATEFGFLNADGSKTYVRGTGFVWDEASGQFTGGAVTSIAHYSPAGRFVDSLTGIAGGLDVMILQAGLESESSAPGITQASLLDGNDTLDGRWHPNGAAIPVTLDGYAGNDLIHGGEGNDRLIGGFGDDTLHGNGGNDHMLGGTGNDRLNGGGGADRLVGGSGGDRLDGGDGNDGLNGGVGNDAIVGGAGVDVGVLAGRFADFSIQRTATGLTVTGAEGTDTLIGVERLGFDDGIYAWSAAAGAWARISTVPGAVSATDGAVIDGTAGNDTGTTGRSLVGTNLDDVIRGFGGNDVIDGGTGSDLLLGGDGDDTIGAGGSGFGEAGDRLYGGNGKDTLTGGGNNDWLFGDDGDDILTGRTGNDQQSGGGGGDLFVFDGSSVGRRTNHWGADIVADFEVGADHLQIISSRTLAYANDTSGNAVVSQTVDGVVDSITLVGVDADSVALADLLI